MKARPLRAFKHASYPSNTRLDPNKVYEVEPATNQPDYEERGKVFFPCPNGAPSLLLWREEYEVVD